MHSKKEILQRKGGGGLLYDGVVRASHFYTRSPVHKQTCFPRKRYFRARVVGDCCMMGKSGHNHFYTRSPVPQKPLFPRKRYFRARVVVDC
eukprot:4205196-Ditylum_brightwellii.AAC.1